MVSLGPHAGNKISQNIDFSLSHVQKYCQNVGYILFVPFSFSGANRNFQIDSVGQLLVLLALNHGKNLSRLVLLSTPLKSCTIISRESLNVGTTWDNRKRVGVVVGAHSWIENGKIVHNNTQRVRNKVFSSGTKSLKNSPL